MAYRNEIRLINGLIMTYDHHSSPSEMKKKKKKKKQNEKVKKTSAKPVVALLISFHTFLLGTKLVG